MTADLHAHATSIFSDLAHVTGDVTLNNHFMKILSFEKASFLLDWPSNHLGVDKMFSISYTGYYPFPYSIPLGPYNVKV